MLSVDRKVLFISMSDVANGAENVILTAADAIGAPMLFLKKVKTGGLTFKSNHQFKYVTNKSMAIGFLGLMSRLKPYRKGYVIMSTHPYLNAYLGFLKRIGYLKSQLIVRECTSVFARFTGLKKWSYKIAYMLGYPAVNLVVCQTDQMKKSFLENVTFVQSGNVIVQENPVCLDQILIKAKSPLNDQDLDTDFICAAGRLIPEKGFSILIRAFNQIEKQYPNLKLLILGEGPEKIFLAQLIETLGLTNRVILKGWTSNPMPYFKHAKVCVVSSIKEGFPNVLLEMMSVNPIVVSTKCAGGIEAMPGILTTDVNNVTALANSIKKALGRSLAPNGEAIQQYLQNRNPEAFIGAVLGSLQ